MPEYFLISCGAAEKRRAGPECNKVPAHDPPGSSLISQRPARSRGNGNL